MCDQNYESQPHPTIMIKVYQALLEEPGPRLLAELYDKHHVLATSAYSGAFQQLLWLTRKPATYRAKEHWSTTFQLEHLVSNMSNNASGLC